MTDMGLPTIEQTDRAVSCRGAPGWLRSGSGRTRRAARILSAQRWPSFIILCQNVGREWLGCREGVGLKKTDVHRFAFRLRKSGSDERGRNSELGLPVARRAVVGVMVIRRSYVGR